MFQFLGVAVAYQYVTNGFPPAALVWVPAGVGLLITISGVVIWCLRNVNKIRSLAGWLLLLGGLTLLVAAFGHAFGVFFLIALPTLLLSGGVALAAATVGIAKRLRSDHDDSRVG